MTTTTATPSKFSIDYLRADRIGETCTTTVIITPNYTTIEDAERIIALWLGLDVDQIMIQNATPVGAL